MILSSVFLKRFVMKVVSLPVHVKVVVSVFWLDVMVGCLGVGLCVCGPRIHYSA